jgi:predicted esterase
MKPGVFGKQWVALLAFLLACGGEAEDAPAGAGGSGAGEAGAAGGGGGGAGSGGAGAGAGGSDAGSGGSDAGSGGGSGSGVFACSSGQAIQPGLNKGWQAGGKARQFYADFPKETGKPLAVVFLFHGYGDSASNFRNFGPGPDTDPDFPFVLITPDDTGLQPFGDPQGLDWALFSGKSSEENIEGALFEEVLGCLGAANTVDPSRVYVMGFSAGAILSNMLYSRYQGKIAASLAFSGAWFSDPEQTKTINTLGFAVDYAWDALAPEASAQGMVLLTHGGPGDTFSAGGQKVIDFELCAQKSDPFLLASKRSFIDCAHKNGHQPHPEFSKKLMVQYFKAHRAGEPSPYLGGKLPAEFPSSCALREP